MITSGLCAVCKLDFMRGVHQPGDKYMIALYDSTADLSPITTTEYTSVGEVKSKGYQAGGMELQQIKHDLDGTTAIMGWEYDPVWKNATLKVHGAMIYNASKENRALCLVAFDTPIISTNGNFRVRMPPVTGTEAPIWID